MTASDDVCFSHTTEVAALEEDEYFDKVSVMVIGGMLVVSVLSALGVRLQVLGYVLYCSASLTKLACCLPNF